MIRIFDRDKKGIFSSSKITLEIDFRERFCDCGCDRFEWKLPFRAYLEKKSKKVMGSILMSFTIMKSDCSVINKVILRQF